MGYTSETLEVNHIVGGTEIYNNFVSNLEWCTCEENIAKAIATGLRHPPYGETHHSTYMTIEIVTSICECIENGYNVKQSFEKMVGNGMTEIPYKKFKPCFYNIKYKRSWKSVSQHFNF